MLNEHVLVHISRQRCGCLHSLAAQGDLSLLAEPGHAGLPFGHIVSYKADHALNIHFAKKLQQRLELAPGVLYDDFDEGDDQNESEVKATVGQGNAYVAKAGTADYPAEFDDADGEELTDLGDDENE